MNIQYLNNFLQEFSVFGSYSYIHLFDRDDKPEKVIAKIWKVSHASPEGVLEDIKKLLLQENLPWEAIAYVANIQVSSEEETRAWLQKMIEIIETNRPAPKKPANTLLKKLGFGKDALEHTNGEK